MSRVVPHRYNELRQSVSTQNSTKESQPTSRGMLRGARGRIINSNDEGNNHSAREGGTGDGGGKTPGTCVHGLCVQRAGK